MTGLKIGIIGTRGFPEVQGGIETHCMELYSRIATNEDVKITVYRRTPYLNDVNKKARYRNIRFVDIPVPKSKNFETLLHSFLATIHALFRVLTLCTIIIQVRVSYAPFESNEGKTFLHLS
jgi:hypothetical protein